MSECLYKFGLLICMCVACLPLWCCFGCSFFVFVCRLFALMVSFWLLLCVSVVFLYGIVCLSVVCLYGIVCLSVVCLYGIVCLSVVCLYGIVCISRLCAASLAVLFFRFLLWLCYSIK